MSWFSHSFSASFRNRANEMQEDEEKEEQVGTSRSINDSSGKGIKNDLSMLTKSLTTQLWGVAAFLAPPPENRSLQSHEGDQNQEAFTSSVFGLIDAKQNEQPVQAIDDNETFVDIVDFGDVNAGTHTTDAELENLPNQAANVQKYAPVSSSADASILQLGSRLRLTGVRSDLAELKGSVATGLSRIMRVVKEEIERDQNGDFLDNKSEPENEFDAEDTEHGTPVSFGKLPRFNTILKPFFGNAFSTEMEKEPEEEFDKILGNGGENSVGKEAPQPQEGILKLSSGLFPLSHESDEEDSDRPHNIPRALGVTEEVLAFARDVSMHPETWLDFPLFSDDEDNDDFEMSEAQEEHVAAVEHTAPRLAALRIELCPGYMSEGRFWKIYFVLLHSRLSRRDAVLLSTPQIVEARALLLRELQKKDVYKSKVFIPSENQGQKMTNTNLSEQSYGNADNRMSLSSEIDRKAESYKIISLQEATEVPSRYFQQYEDQNKGVHIDIIQNADPVYDIVDEVQNKDVLANTVKLTAPIYEDEDAEADEWLHEEPSPHVGAHAVLENDEDVSFSDLEEEEDEAARISVTSKTAEISASRLLVLAHPNKIPSLEEIGGCTATGLNKGNAEKFGWAKDDFPKVLNSYKLSEQVTKLANRGEYSDWLTVDEDDIAIADFL